MADLVIIMRLLRAFQLDRWRKQLPEHMYLHHLTTEVEKTQMGSSMSWVRMTTTG